MKKVSVEQAREKIKRYCAYQERAHSEVRTRLYKYGLFRDEVDEILSGLITEGFLNEERFAKAFAGGKFRLKKWGRIKIVHELEARGLTKNCIAAGLKEIDQDQYRETLREILQRKTDELGEPNLYVLRDRASRYAIQKGYEPELVWAMLKELLPDR